MRPLLVLLVLLVAGCAGPLPAYGETTFVFGAPFIVSKEAPGAEPVIAVGPDGTIYVEGIGATPNGNQNKVFRCTQAGACEDITPSGPGQERSNDGFVAVADDGTLYAANVFSLTFQVYRSADKGATWERLNIPPLPPMMHRHWIVPVGDVVHVTIEAFPPSYAPFLARVPPPALPNAMDATSGMWYARSDDRGDSWSEPVQIDPIVNFAGQSNMVVSADGSRLYVARYEEDAAAPDYTYDDGHWYLLASEDGGDSWERREMFDLTSEISTAVPGLALSTDGALSLVWTQESAGSSIVHVSTSRDGGASWSPPRQPVPAVGTHAMAWGAGTPDGHLAIMWYEAPVSGPASKVDADWRVNYAELDAAGELVGVTRVTPDRVHQGNICAKGPACTGEEDRSLLDYPWMDFGPDGRSFLAFPSTEWDRPSAFAMVAIER